MSTTYAQRLCRIVATYFATILIVGICFGILWGINIAKTNVEKRKDIAQDTVKFLSFLCSFVIIATNQSLRVIVR